MKRYLISVQELDGRTGGAAREMKFEATNHDDVFDIVDRIQQGQIVPESETEEFSLGLKLFSEVVLRHRKEPLFAEIFTGMSSFMKALKAEARR